MLFCLNVYPALRCLIIVQLSFLAFFSDIATAQLSPDTSSATTESPITSSIAARLSRLQNGLDNSLVVADIPLAKAVAQIYNERQARPVWADPILFNALLAALESTEFDGLNPEDYHISILRKQQMLLAERTPNTSKIQADMDLLATDAYFRALYHLYNGKVNSFGTEPEPQWSFELADMPASTVTTIMTDGLTNTQIDQIFSDMRPQHEMYKSMRAGLIHYRTLADLGGWPTLPMKGSLKPGTISPQVAVLRKRLEITGEYRKPAIYPPLSPVRDTVSTSDSKQWTQEILRQGLDDSSLFIPEITTSLLPGNLVKRLVAPVNPDEIFDDRLVQAVKLFQREQYLEEDGAIGPATRTALNVPVAARVAQVRVNLDRIRWLLHNLPEHIVLVDIARFKITYFKANEPIFKSLVQVGMALRTTPLIKSAVNYITFNPTWTVPPTILRDDVLPKVRKDLNYLREHKIRVLSSTGVELDAATIDWNRPGNIILRQDAGGDAALGKAVIRFPNNDSIYLHDTPHQELFIKSQRAFSSGCIRVERALELVTLLLADTPGWDGAAIELALATGETRNVTLAKRVPIMLAYWTVDALSEDRIAFKPDIYDRDRAFLVALNKRISK